jgi:hypothetical protein
LLQGLWIEPIYGSGKLAELIDVGLKGALTWLAQRNPGPGASVDGALAHFGEAGLLKDFDVLTQPGAAQGQCVPEHSELSLTHSARIEQILSRVGTCFPLRKI